MLNNIWRRKQKHDTPRIRRNKRIEREIAFDYNLRILQQEKDPIIEQIFIEYKVIDSKSAIIANFCWPSVGCSIVFFGQNRCE